ncbi:helix-turn-helix domain-containing protein [Bacillus stercoris]|uniref:helix-turn-helix domain-containing protein n=1 Tax=Bacillus stercoris TaxID=2054641 RepID=UPI004045410D
MKLNATPRLHAVMKEKGWTQARLAEESGVTQGSISRFDKNSRHGIGTFFLLQRRSA